MSQIEEQLTDQFYAWEMRGRGWQVWPETVSLEPPFRPFYGHYLPDGDAIDDGRKPSFLGSLVEEARKALGGETEVPPTWQAVEEPEPEPMERGELVEIQASLPANLSPTKESFEQCILSLSYCREPIAFELVGKPDEIVAQLTVSESDAGRVLQQLKAHFPDVVFTHQPSNLRKQWGEVLEIEMVLVDFGLSHEFMLPLATVGKCDPFVGITGALSHLQEGEIALFQVIFEPLRHAWGESILRSVSDGTGGDFFVNAPELGQGAKAKVARPLFATVVRIAVKTEEEGRGWEIAKGIAGAMRVYSHPNGNEFIPLENHNYNLYEHEEDVLCRQSRRSGMILNSDELISLVHLPTTAVRTPKLKREADKTKAAPAMSVRSHGLVLGENTHAGTTQLVTLISEERVRHTYVIGASGTGKSTFLFNLMYQDIAEGRGVAVFDPHGDLIEKILGSIPEKRIDDVVLVDPSDQTHSVGFNILSTHSDLEKNLLASDLVSVFQRLSTSWGDQMGSVLNNAILAFLESKQGGTLADLRRFLIEPKFRDEFLKTVADPEVLYYWKKGFPLLSGSKSVGPILTRLETFLSPKPIRYMVSQKVNRLDFADIMNSGKIFLASLPQGKMGKENSYLMGSLLMAKFQQTAMSRQSLAISERRDFFLYADEFHHFITPSMAEILNGARKYRVGLILAHQELRQLERDREVASAVLSNPYTRICFRLGDADAKALAGGFSFFEANDLQNLGTGKAIGRIERSDYDFNLSIPPLLQEDTATVADIRNRVIGASRQKYAVSRQEIEAELWQRAGETEKPEPTPVEPPRKERPSELPKVVTPPVDIPPSVSLPSKPVAVPVASEPVVKPVTTPGRGGHQHKAIQQRIKSVAEGLGYGVTIEKTLANGSVDIVVEKAGRVIAGEISLTTTIDHEVGNVLKCLKGGFAQVSVICVDEERLVKIGKGVASCVAKTEATRVDYFTPDLFIQYLQESALQDPPPPEQATVRLGKYKVKRTTVQLTEEERKARETSALSQMADLMKSKKSKL